MLSYQPAIQLYCMYYNSQSLKHFDPTSAQRPEERGAVHPEPDLRGRLLPVLLRLHVHRAGGHREAEHSALDGVQLLSGLCRLLVRVLKSSEVPTAVSSVSKCFRLRRHLILYCDKGPRIDA